MCGSVMFLLHASSLTVEGNRANSGALHGQLHREPVLLEKVAGKILTRATTGMDLE